MKKLMIILCLLSLNAWGGEYDMRCITINLRIKDKYGVKTIERCQNSKEVCFVKDHYKSGSLSCFKK